MYRKSSTHLYLSKQHCPKNPKQYNFTFVAFPSIHIEIPLRMFPQIRIEGRSLRIF